MTFDLIKISKSNGFWLLTALFFLSIFYLSLIWKTTGNIDQTITSTLFYGAILYLLWQRRKQINIESDLFSSFIGLALLTIVMTKTLSLFYFESILFTLVPFCSCLSLALIASGFRGLGQYKKELFFAWFLFFPEDIIGFFINNLIKITDLTANVATYFLYYLGFDVTNRGNEILLSLPNIGDYRAIVNYSCTGIPMILLMLKLSFLLISIFPIQKSQSFLIPLVSISIGFFLGVIRVCIMTLVIPKQVTFDYWHGSEGAQIFSTVAMMIFSGFAYWILHREKLLDSQNNKLKQPRHLLQKRSLK